MIPQYVTCCRQFEFAAAHHLPGYPGKCNQVHGHTWKLGVCFYGRVGKDGMLIDFSVLKRLVEQTVLNRLDHTDLNLILDNPTAENLIQWIWTELSFCTYIEDAKLHKLKLWESDNSYVEFKGL